MAAHPRAQPTAGRSCASCEACAPLAPPLWQPTYALNPPPGDPAHPARLGARPHPQRRPSPRALRGSGLTHSAARARAPCWVGARARRTAVAPCARAAPLFPGARAGQVEHGPPRCCRCPEMLQTPAEFGPRNPDKPSNAGDVEHHSNRFPEHGPGFPEHDPRVSRARPRVSRARPPVSRARPPVSRARIRVSRAPVRSSEAPTRTCERALLRTPLSLRTPSLEALRAMSQSHSQ